MLREVLHFLSGVPMSLRLKTTLPQAALYDALMVRADEAGLYAQRHALAAGLKGEVLEIGAGSGLMFPHYGAGVEVTALEPDERFSALARPRADEAAARIQIIDGSVESLPFEAARFDAVVIAFVLCSVPSVPDALREIARVLRPGGELRLLEHVRSERPVAGRLMDLTDPIWLALNGQGCHLNRRAEPLLEEGGFRLDEVRPFQIWSRGLPAFPMRWIRASTSGG